MKVSELGEFPLIQRIARVVAESGPCASDLLVGIGDDAAAWRSVSPVTLATTDSLIQGVHFDLATVPWRDLGWKALAANLSDIAAMGGRPRYVLVSLGLPPDTEVEAVMDFYRGLMELAREFGVAVAGGNLSRASEVSIHLSLLGEALEEGMLLRSSARPGDTVAVTGYLGGAAAGLKALTEGSPLEEALRLAHLRPRPRVAEGQALVRCGIRAAIDISDGLLQDLSQMGLASGTAARVWFSQVPVHPLARQALPTECLELALSGGEDYELLFTGPQEQVEAARRALSLPVTAIGRMEVGKAGRVTLVDGEGREVAAGGRGWDHFSPG